MTYSQVLRIKMCITLEEGGHYSPYHTHTHHLLYIGPLGLRQRFSRSHQCFKICETELSASLQIIVVANVGREGKSIPEYALVLAKFNGSSHRSWATHSCSLLVLWPCWCLILGVSPLSYHRLSPMCWWV